MRRPDKAGGKAVKAQRRRRLTRRNASKAARRRNSSASGQKAKVARLRERKIRKRIQMELRTSEDRWQSLLENPIFGVNLLDEHQRFITANQTYQTMLGYSIDELRQLTPLDLSVPGEREINEALIKEMQEGKRQHFEMIKRLRRKDGKLIWISLYVFAITDWKSGGNLTFGIAFDITEKKQAQDALQEMRAELARNARINQMVAMTGSIAHEINQPL
ncbi:MAG: PAS domain S-box protein, partial [Pseudolabrys sp.]